MTLNQINTLYETRCQVNSYITEELGISDYVGEATKELYIRIIDEIGKSPKFYLIYSGREIKSIIKQSVSFKFEFNGMSLTVSVDYYNFKDVSVRHKWSDVLPDELFNNASSIYGDFYLSDTARKKKKPFKPDMVSLNLVGISGRIDKVKAYRSISHELRHVYEQYSNRRKPFSEYNDNALYMKCADYFNYAPKGSTKSNIGLTGYLSFNYERRALVEEFFRGIEAKIENAEFSNKDLMEILKNNNDVFYKMSVIKSTINRLTNNDSEYVKVCNDMLQETGFTIDKFTKRCISAFNDLCKRYGKCIIKLKNDYPDIFLRNGIGGNVLEHHYQKKYAKYFV